MKLANKAMLLMLVMALFGASIVAAQPKEFKDVSSSYWGYEAIQWGVEQNIITGYKDGTFRPNNSVTEEEFIAMLVRAFGMEPTTDSRTIQNWSNPYYQVASEHNLPVTYLSSLEINRQSVAQIIVATRGVNFSGNDAVQYMLNKGLANGKFSSTIEGYAGQDTLTRAEAISFIKNVMDNTENKTMLVMPRQSSPKFLLEQSEEIQFINPKALEVLEQTVQHFNNGLKRAGLDSSYQLSFSTLALSEAESNNQVNRKVYYSFKSILAGESVDFAYHITISTFADSGELDSVRVSVSDGGKLKELVQSAIHAVIQDAEESKQFYETQKLSTLIDNAPKGNSSNVIKVSDQKFRAVYFLLKSRELGQTEFHTAHIFEIGKL